LRNLSNDHFLCIIKEMKKLILSTLVMFLILPSVAEAKIDTEAFSVNFKTALSSQSPLSPPDHFAKSLKPLTKTSPFNNTEVFRNKMRRTTLPRKELKNTKKKALNHINRVKTLIAIRQKNTHSKITSASKVRFDFLIVAATKDLDSGMVKINKVKAEEVAKADADKRVQTTVLNIKINTEISICNQSINQARSRLKKKGLTAKARKNLLASINTWRAKRDSLEKRRATEKRKIEKAHANKIRAADSKLSLNKKTINTLYDQNIKRAEDSVNQENAAAIKHLNSYVYMDRKRLDSLTNSLERVLTGTFKRIVQLGGSETPKKIKPKKQKVSKKKKQAAKKKAAKRGRAAGAKHLKKTRRILYRQLA